MADRVYPSGKPNTRPPQALNVGGGGGGGGGGGAAAAFPATKSQMYQRPAYRPQAPKSRRRSGRSCCCSCVLWTLLALVGLVLLAAIAGGIFYVLYRPHRPTFAVSSLRLSALNLSSSGDLLTSSLDVSVAVRNPNKKIAFLYDPISATASSASGGVDVGDGSFPGFAQGAKNTTVLKATLAASRETVDPSAAADLKKGGTLGLRIDLETKAGVKIGKVTTKKIGIRVRCEGIQVAAPKGKSSSSSSSAPAMDVACKVKLRIKIWKWTF
ncbi:Protein YLS9 [Ananas comosus]|uniref:Protein YLS9 n=1 Tax=Ananas comosus TaxID=4615 RepID=A0A199W3Y3_ANACO|nr:Protein YLS9 [Ananas comosus]